MPSASALRNFINLRGRIGPWSRTNRYCILVTGGKVPEEASARHRSDGAHFQRVSRSPSMDFELRGPGEFFGTRQHGDAASLAQPLRDHEILELARREPFTLAENPEQAAKIIASLESISPAWHKRYQLASVG